MARKRIQILYESVIDVVPRSDPVFMKFDTFSTEHDGYFPPSNVDAFSELSAWYMRFMRKYGVGMKLDKSKWGNQKITRIRQILFNQLRKDTETNKVTPKATSPLKVYDTLIDTKSINTKDITPYDIQRVARTEVANLKSIAQLEAYKEAGLKYVIHKTRNDVRVSKQCSLLNNKEFNIDELLQYQLGTGKRIPIHPNCLLKSATITMELGHKKINKVCVGDKVLTHKGNYKEVIDVHKNPSPKNLLRVTLEGKELSLTITPEHPVLTKRGWVNAGELTEDDEVAVFQNFCKTCSKPFNPSKRPREFCGVSCKSKHDSKEHWRKTKGIEQDIITKPIVTTNITFVKVKEIRKTKYSSFHPFVYNISVKDDESYVANGMIVHNCRCRYIPSMKGVK